MPIVATGGNNAKFEPCPEGLHTAVCVDVVDKGLVNTQWGPQHKVQIRWETEQHFTDEKGNDRPYMVVNTYTLSLNEKSNLYKMLRTWRGKPFTAQELEGFDLETLIGVNCQLVITHNVMDDGRVFANIAACTKLPPTATKIRPSAGYVRDCNRTKTQQPQTVAANGNDDDIPF